MEQRKFNALLYRTLLVPLVMLAALAAVLLLQTQYLRTSMRWVDHSDQVIGSSRQLLRLAVDAETGVRGYLLTGDDRFLEPYLRAERSIDGKTQELMQLVSDNPEQQERLRRIQSTFSQWEQHASRLLELRRNGDNYVDVGLNLEGKELMDSVRRQRDEFLAREEQLRDERVRRAEKASFLTTTSCVVLSFGVGIFLAVFTRNQLHRLGQRFQKALDESNLRAAQIERSEQRWVTTLTSIGDAVIATDAEGKVTFMNDLAERLSGWKSSAAAGKPTDEVFEVVHEESGEHIENPVMQALRLNRVVELANHAVLKKTGIPVEDSAAPIIGSKGETAGVVLVFRDVTERRRRIREKEQALLSAQVARKMAEDAAAKVRRIQAVTDVALSHATLNTLLEELLYRSCEVLKADMAVILLADERNENLRVRAALGLEKEVLGNVEIPIGKGMAGTVASTGRRRIINDLSKVEVASPILREKAASLIAVPLVAENRTIGVMHVDSATPRIFTEEEAEVLQLVGDRVALAIDRAQREEKLHRISRTLQALNSSNQALLRANDEAELLNSVCSIVTKDCGHSMVWIGFAEDDPRKSVRPAAYAGFEHGYLETLNVTWADNERGRGPTGTAIRTGKASTCADMLSDPAFEPWRGEALKRGYASSLVVPLMKGEKAFGAMTIYSREKQAFSQEEISLLSELAGDLSFGLLSLRARAAQERAERELLKASEQRRLALEGADLGAWEVRLDTDEVYWDEQCRKMFGVLEGSTIEYREAIARIHPGDASGIDEAVKRAVAGENGGAYHTEFRVVWPDGSVHWIASHGRVYFEGDEETQKAVRFIGVNMEITERKKAEAALRESEQRWATTLSSIGDAVISTDARGRVVFMNAVAEQLSGWNVEEARGVELDTVFNIVNEVTRKKPESPVAKVLRLNQVVGLANHTVLIRRDGNEVPIDDSAAPIRDAKGDVNGVVLVFRDVSERKKAEEALRNSERLAVTGQMAASIAHEIHNPLDAVGNLLFMIRSGADEEATQHYAAMASDELERVVQMTKHMLAFNREAKKPVPLKIGDVLATVTELYSGKIQSAGISVEQHLEFHDEIPAFPSEMRQVLANLVGNAIEALPPRGKIAIHAYGSRDWKSNRAGLRVTVADNGHGIPKEIQDRIFDPFFTTKGESGTGLGLWITAGIVEKHEGLIRVWSSTREGKSGTCFSVFLPFERSVEVVAPGLVRKKGAGN